VTSPGGAAVHDFLRVLHRRFPNLPVLVVPARVQGEGAAGEIARGITRASKQRGVEIVVVARGGGSLEDLWAFNEEVVARALAAGRPAPAPGGPPAPPGPAAAAAGGALAAAARPASFPPAEAARAPAGAAPA